MDKSKTTSRQTCACPPSQSQLRPHPPPQSQPQSQPRPQSSPHCDPIRILLGLLRLLMEPKPDSRTIITYIEQHRIDPNTYLPVIHSNIQIPLIFYCCSDDNLTDLFLYLIDRHVDLNARMICDDPSQQIDLLYYSQIPYIRLLVENGARVNPLTVTENIEKLMIGGNINKLVAMYKHGALCKEQILPVIQKKGLIFRVLDRLYEKVFNLSKQVEDKTKFIDLYEIIIKSYINTFKFCFKNGVSVNQVDGGDSFTQKVLNTYCVPLVQFVISYQTSLDTEELMHYSNFDQLNRQVMKYIYNDQNYVLIGSLIKDKLIPKKIIVKKGVGKKVIRVAS